MDETKAVNKKEIERVSGETGFDVRLLTKDYYLTCILYLIKDIKGIYFKGGTAIQKILLNHPRLSEDIDFTATRDINEIVEDIKNKLKNIEFIKKITKDKDVEGFVRLVVHYKNISNEDDIIFIDINKRAKLHLVPETHEIKHFYEESIPKFSVKTLNMREMIAEKMAAAIGRNRPRDHFDLYNIISHNVAIDVELVKKKCEDSGDEFNIIKIFNKASKLKHRWDQDMIPLLAEEISFETVMQTIAKYFKLKEAKEKLKDKKKVSSQTLIN